MITVSKNKRCICGSGKKAKSCHPVHPKSRGAELLKLYRSLEEETEKHFQNSDWQSPCTAGCYRCCYDDFDISQTEFDLLILEMKSWPQEEFHKVLDKAWEQTIIQIKEKPDIMQVLTGQFSEVGFDQLTRGSSKTLKENRNSFPCPLLDQGTGKCRVYNSRPLICRLYGVTESKKDESDREICEYLPSRTEVKDKLLDSNHFVKQYFDIIEPYLDPIGERIIDRKRPIFLWFIALIDKIKAGAQYLDADNLMASMEDWNNKQLNVIKQRIRDLDKA